MKRYLLGAALALGLTACNEPEFENHFPATPEYVVAALKSSTLPVEKKEVESCYFIGIAENDLERKFKTTMYTWTVGDTEVKFLETTVDAYMTILGNLSIKNPRVSLKDIHADGLDSSVYPVDGCEKPKKTYKETTALMDDGKLRFFAMDGREFISDNVYVLAGEKMPLTPVIVFTEAGLELASEAYTSELEKLLEAAGKNRK